MSTLPITEIRRESELQCRARGINKRTVTDYADAMKGGAAFPPVTVFLDSKGVHWLADGFHRLAAAELAQLTEIAVDVREGDRKAMTPAEGGEFPTTPENGEVGPVPRSEPVDLAPVYARTLKAHATREPAEHVRALFFAIIELHGDTTPEQIVSWLQARSEPAPIARDLPRRRIIQPRGAAANGGQP